MNSKTVFKKIVVSFHPYARLLLLFLLLTVTFSEIYLMIPDCGFSDKLSGFIDAFYLSIVTVTTLGYGDITPELSIAKLATILESLFGLVFFGISINTILEHRNRKEYRRLFQISLKMVNKVIEQLMSSYKGEKRNGKSFEDYSTVKSLLHIDPFQFQFTDYSLQSIYIYSRYIINDFNLLSLKSKGTEFLHFSTIITNLQSLKEAPIDELIGGIEPRIQSGEESLQQKLYVVLENVEVLNEMIKKNY